MERKVRKAPKDNRGNKDNKESLGPLAQWVPWDLQGHKARKEAKAILDYKVLKAPLAQLAQSGLKGRPEIPLGTPADRRPEQIMRSACC